MEYLDRKSSLHSLSINGDVLKLDGFELKGVRSYSLNRNADDIPRITIELYLCEDSLYSTDSVGDNTNGDLAKGIQSK